MWLCGGIGMRVHGKCLMMLVLIDWHHYLKEGLISGGDCNVCTMVGVSMAPETANLFLRHPQMALRYFTLIFPFFLFFIIFIADLLVFSEILFQLLSQHS